MRVSMVKRSDEVHRFEVVRDDGSRDGAELVSRSFLLHDLIHFAVEVEAGARGGFYGLLASGTKLAELDARDGMAAPGPPRTEIDVVEMVVGPMTAVIQRDVPAEAMIAGVGALFEAWGVAPPAWLDAAYVGRVKERMRALLGRWRSVRYGEALELSWPGG